MGTSHQSYLLRWTSGVETRQVFTEMLIALRLRVNHVKECGTDVKPCLNVHTVDVGSLWERRECSMNGVSEHVVLVGKGMAVELC